jgi:small basic protein
MMLVPLLALLLGILLASLWTQPVPGVYGQYLAIASLAGLDTVCGGIRSGLEGKFNTPIFVTGFFSNIIIAFGLAWLGDRIFIDLFLVVALVLGQRIFVNLSLVRRYIVTRMKDIRDRRELERTTLASGQPVAAISQADSQG